MSLPPFPANTRQLIEEMISYDGRDVTFYIITTVSGCDSCNLDPLTNTSVDSYCATCSGMYWIPFYSGWTVTAHVTWGRSEDIQWVTGGMIDNGECQVKFMHTDEAERVVFSSQWVDVDGREMDIDRIILRGVPEINRILVKLKEKER